MTDLERIVLYVTLLFMLSTFVFTLLIFINNRKRKDEASDVFKSEIKNIESGIKDSIFDSYAKVASTLTEQMVKTTDVSKDNLQELSDKVAKGLMEFQEKTTDRFDKEFKELTESINQKMLVINEKVEQKLSKGFEDANNTFVQIAKRVEVIDEAQKNIQELSKEMVTLQNILSNNQARGSYGEFQLNQLLRVVYGEYEHIYKTQYTLKEGKDTVRADAVVFLPEPNGMIAIDSKFPFSAFSQLFDNKDLTKDEETKLISQFSNEVKKHITDISNKYIIPTITTDYALMFVPSDGILALLHSKLRNVIDYSRERKVTIVSPTTIIPLLSSFKAFMIDYEKNKYTDQINDQLLKLSKDFKLFNQDWTKLTNSIESLKRNSDNINNRVEKITEKFGKIEKIGINQESPEALIEELDD